ncbi:response regulator transcription factor [Streptomyces sp. BH097]|uniref:response regulator transcription factor n=1 Tax=unclassified Streptomyces TaxID=2593676 RepID=UPI003BB6D157
MRVLVVEDHEELAETVAAGLRRQGMAVDVVYDGDAALERVTVHGYDVVVLDRDLPGVHGDQVCRALAAGEGRRALGAGQGRERVLMLTASGTVADRVAGLGMGADDYLPKPFAFTELVARVRALGRRAGPVLPPVLVHGDLRLDPGRREAVRAGRHLPLSPKEFAVLELLLAAQGTVVSAEELLERAWDEAADPFTQTVKVTVSRLRRKLGDPPLIETVDRAGYRV